MSTDPTTPAEHIAEARKWLRMMTDDDAALATAHALVAIAELLNAIPAIFANEVASVIQPLSDLPVVPKPTQCPGVYGDLRCAKPNGHGGHHSGRAGWTWPNIAAVPEGDA